MDAPTIGIGRLLKEGGRFTVPDHQRDYSWTEDEIEQLFDDIEQARLAGQKEYFLGLMVFLPTAEREFTILDGQQRLATTAVILASIRSWLRARDFQTDADQIQDTYLATRELGSSEYLPLIVLNENNNPSFVDFVISEAPEDDVEREKNNLKRYDPNRKLLEAVLFCRKQVQKLAESAGPSKGSSAASLFETVRYLEDRVKVVRLNVSSEANAYTVFETLNDRGLDLSVLDLVKNHVFGRVTDANRLRDTQARWTQLVANLVAEPADDFLKAWWTSRYGRVQTAQLFPRFKEKVSSAAEALATSEDMLKASEMYAALGIADDPIWSEVNSKPKEIVRVLRLLGAKQARPVLLSALERLQVRELERLLHLLEVVMVRYQLVGGGRTGKLEIGCARLAHRIFKEEVRTATEAAEVLREVLPVDDEFRIAFRAKQERNNQKVKYLLSRLEIQARRGSGRSELGDELEPLRALTVEHILPRAPSNDWSDLTDSDPLLPEECTYKVGNICLLTSINRALGGRSFAEKRGIFAKSDLVLTKDLSSYSAWSRKEIEERQEKLADLAVSFWRFQ